MEGLGRHVSTETSSCNNRRAVFNAVRAEGLYKGQGRSFKSVEFRDVSLPGYELGSKGIELRSCGIRIIECSSVELKD
jgi:hypothetical protein